MSAKSLRTAYTLLTTRGPAAVARVTTEKAAMWCRHGRPFELGKFVGRPTPIARLDGCEFELDWPAVVESVKYLLLSGKHERPERTLVKQFVSPHATVVELGGAFGVVSCITNRMLKDPSRHVVVEANPSVIPVLTANRNRNGCRFEVLHRALAYDAAAIPFGVEANPLASSVQSATAEEVIVPTTTLRAIVDERGFERCALICDIEGMEVELVRHEADTLRAHVDTIVLELHERMIGLDRTTELLRRLHEIGFDVAARIYESVALTRR